MKKVEMFQNYFKDPVDREVLSTLCKSWYAHYVNSHATENYPEELNKMEVIEVTTAEFVKYFSLMVKFDRINYPDKITFYSPASLECFRIDGFTGKVIDE